MPVVQINGCRTHYEDTGHGPALVFLHGGFGGLENFGISRHPWWAEKPFGRYFRVISYDRRGSGLSEVTPDGYTLEGFGSDLLALLEYLQIERPTIVAGSSGGPIALRFALDHPQLVERLVLMNTAADLLAGEQGLPLTALLRGMERQTGEAQPLPPAQNEQQRAALASLTVEQQGMIYDAWLQTLRAYRGIDLTPELHRVNAPALIVHGADDENVPLAGAYRMAAALPNASLRILPNEPHGLAVRPESRAPGIVLRWLLGETDEPDEDL